METLTIYNKEDNSQEELQLAEVKKFLTPNLTEQEFWLFIQTAKTLGLNPLRREIYAVKYGDKFNIITGYEVYLKRANQSQLIEWWKVEIRKPSDDFKTWVGVFTAKRKDWTQEFVWEVPMIECYKNQATWQTMREFMLKKTTIGQGFRLFIPEVLAGMPYIAEELGSQVIESEYTEIPPEQKIEPDIDETLAKEKVKTDYLDNLARELQSIESVKDLEAKYKSQVNSISKSTMKTEIIAIYANRKEALTVLAIAEICDMSISDVQSLIDTKTIEQSLVDEVISGNKDAIGEFATRMANFLNERYKANKGELV